ncbi:MAG: glutamate formimidoyltransferase [bacterium]|nr:glutamate formimidoyltransferase [bacterium]
MAALIEWVPNISEGRRGDVVKACVEPLKSIEGVKLLDYSSDPDHNRSVITCVGDPKGLKEATLALYARAVELIDMNQHSGEHSRIGAVDVCPYVPVRDAQMSDCDALAKECARAVAEKFNLPVYLYRESATAPHRQSQSDIRKGEYEGLSAKLRDPLWKPDFGPDKPHPTAGATIIGARPFLIAFNVNLGTTDVGIGKRIAKAIRGSSGGFINIQGAGFYLEDHEEGPVAIKSYDEHGAMVTHQGSFARKTGMVQISMNFLDYTKTPLFRVVETIRREAARYGVPIIQTELVGLAPADAFIDSAKWYMQVDNLKNTQIIDFQI